MNRACPAALLAALLALGPVCGLLAQDARALYEQGVAAEVEESYARAVELYKASLARNPSYYQPMVGLAESYLLLGEYEEALHFVQDARKLARDDTSIMNLEGRIRIGLGELDAAAKIFGDVLAREPNNLEARFGQAELDVASGRKRQAALRYVQSLQTAPNNKKALVSLAYLYEDLGERDTAAKYVDLALKFHMDDPQVHFVAARELAPSDPARAMEHLELALAMKEAYPEATYLLARLALNAGDEDRVVGLMTGLLGRSSKDTEAWYLLGSAQALAGRVPEAVNALGSALLLQPDYEVARVTLENLALDKLPMNDAKRRELSDYHTARGDSLRQKHFLAAAQLEYRRALQLEPEAVQARLAYAAIFRANGFPRKYLSELGILASLGKADADTQAEIEVRTRELGSGIAGAWGVDQYSIEHPKMTLLVAASPGGNGSTAEVRVKQEDADLARYLRDMLLRKDTIEIVEAGDSAQSFDQAFRAARAGGIDYFLLVSFSDTDRSFSISSTLYLGRTGGSLGSGVYYRTGNDRIRDASALVSDAVAAQMPLHGVLLKRDFSRGLVDLGSAQGIAPGLELAIVKKGTTRLLPPSGNLTVGKEDTLGSFTIEQVDENAAQGKVTVAGYFDRINAGDEVILAPVAPPAAPPPAPARAGLLRRLFGIGK